MADKRSHDSGEPSFLKTILDDLKSFFENMRRGVLKRTLRRDFKELRDFYFDEKRKSRLKGMCRFNRWIYTSAWLLKAFLLKLTSTRRILLVISLLFLLLSRNNSDNKPIIGGLILLFVLLLELKDKLLAQNELMAGHAVQHALMPDRKPVVPGWELWLFSRPANEVGGDLVDYLQVNKNRFGVVLGDVAGKGLRAALLMAKLQATLRALIPDFASLGELGTKINKIIYRDGLPNSFASLVYLELQPHSGLLCVLNAGHLPPIAIKGAKIEEMQKGEPALGILPEMTYTEQRIELRKGDFLFAYSDGLTEARNDQGDFFGEQRLLELLPKLIDFSAEEVGERLLAEIDHFLGDVRANDDLSMVVLKRLD